MAKEPRLFISYRISDTGPSASALFRDLSKKLGESAVFLDHARIRGGEQWPTRIRDEAESATVMLALVGKKWLFEQNQKTGRRRLDEPDDWVRQEIAGAIDRSIPIVPVLVEDAELPSEVALPEPIQALVNFQACKLRREDWRNDVDTLLTALGDHGFERRLTTAHRIRRPEHETLGPVTEKELRGYRIRLAADHREVPLSYYVTKLHVTVPVERLYVPLRAVPDAAAAGNAVFANAADATKKLVAQAAAQPVALASAFEFANRLGDRHGLMLLGDPGAGKTMALRHAIRQITQLGENAFGLAKDYIPVFLPLRELDDDDDSFEEFVGRQLLAFVGKSAKSLGQRLLAQHNLLLLFDGLDEIPSRARRSELLQWLDHAINDHPDCRFVVTSRYAGYGDDVRADPDFLELHLQPFDDAQVGDFVRNWFGIVERHVTPDAARASQRAVAEANELIKTLASRTVQTERILELVPNPLLLTATCLVHRDRGRLPARRVELYDECTTVLLAQRNGSRRGASRVPGAHTRRALQQMARWLHGEGQERATIHALEPVLTDALAVTGGNVAAADFLQTVRDETGLLTRWDDDSYGFACRAFQEFLTARSILDEPEGDALPELAARFGDSWWREVGLLVVALGDAALVERYMTAVVARPDFGEHAELMAACLVDARERNTKPLVALLNDSPGDDESTWKRQLAAFRVLRATARDEATALAEGLREHPLPALRELAIETLQRKETVPSPHGELELRRIPAGSFRMGPGASEDAYPGETPAHDVEVAEFYLSPTPVTNAQYERYRNANPGVAEPAHWGDGRFNQPDQPVVGVSWDDALAFCAWAGVRLPSEAEWEYACRAGTTTPFHTGETVTTSQVNYDGNYPYGDTPAGEYRERPVGVQSFEPNDWGLYGMHGNVWEWCADLWHDGYDGAPTDGSAWLDGDSDKRVLRGGAWPSPAQGCRSAVRLELAPGTRGNAQGFRPALSADR